MSTFKVIPVVAGIIMIDGLVLLTKRHSMYFDTNDKWELPGGKVEEKESLEVALKRELRQELCDLDVNVVSLAHAQMNYYSFGSAMVTYFNCLPVIPYRADELSKRLKDVEHILTVPKRIQQLTCLPGTVEALSHVL